METIDVAITVAPAAGGASCSTRRAVACITPRSAACAMLDSFPGASRHRRSDVHALTVVPLKQGSAAVTDVPDPEPAEGELLVDGVALGVCGTDIEIVAGDYGWAPPGEERLILGDESLGRGG